MTPQWRTTRLGDRIIAWRETDGQVVNSPDATSWYGIYRDYVHVCRDAERQVWILDGRNPHVRSIPSHDITRIDEEFRATPFPDIHTAMAALHMGYTPT